MMRGRVALLAVLTAGVICAGSPSEASAFQSYYNCVLKPVGQWCDGRANGSFDGLNSWDYNEGWYPGAGTVTACEHVWRPATGNELGTGTCGTNWTAQYYGAVSCACYEAEVRQYSGGDHSINGFADSAY